MEYMFMPLKRYADFSGRSRRKEYWLFTLFVLIVEIVLYVWMGASLASGMDEYGEYQGSGAAFGLPFILLMIFAFGVLVPSIAVSIRRLHDQDKSGWYILMGLIPLVGGIILIVFMCTDGTRGSNRFGPDPKGNTADTFA